MAGMKKFSRILSLLCLAVLLAGCGGTSSEKLDEVKAQLTELENARAHAEEVYDTLYDDALFSRVTEAGKQVDVFLSTDYAKTGDADIDAEVLPAMRELEDTYAELQTLLDQTLKAEEAGRAEAESRRTLTFHIINATGQTISCVTWMQGTGKSSAGLLSLPGELADGETLAGITVPVVLTNPEKELFLVGETPEGESLRYSIGDINGINEEALFYLKLLPDGQKVLSTNPSELS